MNVDAQRLLGCVWGSVSVAHLTSGQRYVLMKLSDTTNVSFTAG
jgi:hypothetical protein